MAKQRASIDLGGDDAPVDPVALAASSTHPKPAVDRETIQAVSDASGFASREPKPATPAKRTRRSRRKESPYDYQKGIRMRSGIRDLFHELVDHLDLKDAETFERAVLALIEKEGTEEQLAEYHKLMQG